MKAFPTGLDHRFLRRAAVAVGLLGLLWQLSTVVIGYPDKQWDFRAYYHAPLAAAAGEDPYDHEAMDRVTGEAVFAYTYPPHTLVVFRLANALPYETAYYVYLAIKVGALAGLLVMLASWLRPSRTAPIFLLMAFLGFNGAVPLDLRAGNVAALEALLLFLAFAAFVRQRWFAFALLVVGASFFKLVPVAFLGLLLFGDGRRRWAALAVGCGAFLALLGVASLTLPELTDRFFGFTSTAMERSGVRVGLRGAVNPNARDLIKDVFILLGAGGQRTAIEAAYGVFALVVAGVSLAKLFRLARTGDRLHLLAFATVAYAVVIPRMVTYSYVWLVFPVVFLLGRCGRPRLTACLLAAAMVPTRWVSVAVCGHFAAMGPDHLWRLPWEYSAWMVVAAVWLVALRAPSGAADVVAQSP